MNSVVSYSINKDIINVASIDMALVIAPTLLSRHVNGFTQLANRDIDLFRTWRVVQSLSCNTHLRLHSNKLSKQLQWLRNFETRTSCGLCWYLEHTDGRQIVTHPITATLSLLQRAGLRAYAVRDTNRKLHSKNGYKGWHHTKTNTNALTVTSTFLHPKFTLVPVK